MSLHIGFLVFPRVQQLDLTGPHDVFALIPGATVHLVGKTLDPVSASKWLQPPFGGVIADGFIWGRGTLDDKGAMMALHEAAETLLARFPRRATWISRRGSRSSARKPDVIQRRLATASREIANYGEYDYILVNDRLEQAADELKAVVQAERLLRAGRELTDEEKRLAVMAERCRLVNMRERAQGIVDSFLDGAG